MNKTIKWIGGLIIVLVVLVLILSQKTGQINKVEPIKIGAILPLTGPQGSFGGWMQEGINLALEDINTNKIGIIYEDSKSDPKEGVTAFNKLLEVDNTKIMISAMSSVSVPLVPLAEQNKVLLFVQDVRYPNFSKDKTMVLRHFIQSDREAPLMADYSIDKLRASKVGILYVNDEAGQGAKEAFKNEFEKRGGQVVDMESYLGKDTDMKTQILKIKESGANSIYLSGNGPSWAQSLKQIKELNFKGNILTDTAMFIPTFRNIAGSSTEGVYFTYPYADTSSQSYQTFISKYNAKYGKEPAIESYYAWDLIHVINAALENNNWKTDNLKQVIVNMKEFNGAFGKTIINSDGDFLTPIGIGVIKNGQIDGIKVVNP